MFEGPASPTGLAVPGFDNVRAEIATELSDPPLLELAAQLSSVFVAKDRDMGASTPAG